MGNNIKNNELDAVKNNRPKEQAYIGSYLNAIIALHNLHLGENFEDEVMMISVFLL